LLSPPIGLFARRSLHDPATEGQKIALFRRRARPARARPTSACCCTRAKRA
jgi:hypothetical protein